MDESRTLEQAVARVRSLVEETADEVLPGLPRTPKPYNEDPRPCFDAVGAETEETQTQWGVEIGLDPDADASAIIRRTSEYWTSKGYPVNDNHARGDPPALFLQEEGYSYQMLVNTEAGAAFLGGNTPCFPPLA